MNQQASKKPAASGDFPSAAEFRAAVLGKDPSLQVSSVFQWGRRQVLITVPFARVLKASPTWQDVAPLLWRRSSPIVTSGQFPLPSVAPGTRWSFVYAAFSSPLLAEDGEAFLKVVGGEWFFGNFLQAATAASTREGRTGLLVDVIGGEPIQPPAQAARYRPILRFADGRGAVDVGPDTPLVGYGKGPTSAILLCHEDRS